MCVCFEQIINDLGRCGVISVTYDALYSTVCDNALDGFVRHNIISGDWELLLYITTYVSIAEWLLAWYSVVYDVHYSSSGAWYCNL